MTEKEINDLLMAFVSISDQCARCAMNHGKYGCFFAKMCVSDNMCMFKKG